MTHLDVYRCDRQRCPEEKPTDYSLTVPNGWLVLLVHPKSKHFCSLACLAVWARAERAAMEVLYPKVVEVTVEVPVGEPPPAEPDHLE